MVDIWWLQHPTDRDNSLDFYKEFYSSKVKLAKTDFYIFFTNLNIPKLDSVSKDDIDSAISEDELLKAIRAFPSGKAAGPAFCFTRSFMEEDSFLR